jgi:pimeloyl-ACP methyl ester carboxylesterase
MLIGDHFDPGFLEVINEKPPKGYIGDGFDGIMGDYCDFLNLLKANNWGPLGKIFEFPVYAVGYNWTDDNEKSGILLAARIVEIIAEAKAVTGLCEKVILITHSMGGLVARAASKLSQAESLILGIIHGVQPATGAPAAYWRMKAGFEGEKKDKTSDTLGGSGPHVTAIFANSPAVLELLPNLNYRADEEKKEQKQWLPVMINGKKELLPKKNPYLEIYNFWAEVRPDEGSEKSVNKYWALVDPALLDPQEPNPKSAKGAEKLNVENPPTHVFREYLDHLFDAAEFHRRLGKYAHPKTFCFRGTGKSGKNQTANVIKWELKSGWPEKEEHYLTRGFVGYYRDKDGKPMQAVLKYPAGKGDGTVPYSSAGPGALDITDKPPIPDHAEFPVDHQPAYQNPDVQKYTIKAIIALCKCRYDEVNPKKNDSQATPSPGVQ